MSVPGMSCGLLVVATLLNTVLNTVPARAESPASDRPASLTETEKDFEIQGEYLGVLSLPDRLLKYGVQVIALGDATFKASAGQVGLPGMGQRRDPGYLMGRRDGELAQLPLPGGGGFTIKNDALTFRMDGNRIVGTLEKIDRASPSLGAKPPPGSMVLFAGDSLDGWRPGAELTPDGHLKPGAISEQLVQSYQAHLEFQLPFEPHARGTFRANSGLFVQGRYEIKILDSFGLETNDTECGAIYRQASPDVNMSFPPRTWQTFDLHFRAARYSEGKKIENARITVLHNFVTIHEDVELLDVSEGAPFKEGPQPGPAVFLAESDREIRFRNIWVVEK